MKVRVFSQGFLICGVIWVLVLAAQGYFRGLRSTAENLGKVVENEEFADWSREKGEPTGENREVRERRIREVVSLLVEQISVSGVRIVAPSLDRTIVLN